MIWKIAAFAGFLLSFSGAPSFAQSNVATAQGDAVVLRALDTITGAVEDLEIGVGQGSVYERLVISVKECRYPKANAASDAFAYLLIQDIRDPSPVFEGWMIASSPALSALEHPRYDVWVLRCSKNSE